MSDHSSASRARALRDRWFRIREVADDCLRRWAAGEVISEQDILDANAGLLPDLAEELKKLRLIIAAEQNSGGLQDVSLSEMVTEEFSSKCDSKVHELGIRCPFCRNIIELMSDTAFTDITCHVCGSTFSLVGRETATRLAAPLKSVGHFELISRLGEGGFATVWKAHDSELDRTVAVKIPRFGALDPTDEEQFLREARAAAQLRHPNIVPVHEVGREGDTLYIVSDFVRGVTLSDWLTGQSAGFREVAEIIAEIADAVHYAHQSGIIHRDLKLSNVMLDTDGRTHIMDFGLAKRETGEVTVTIDGQVLGTPAYMAPEQAQGAGHLSDRRSDVYSLGAMLFQLLTGELPFRGSAQMQIYQKLTEDAPSPRKLNKCIPRDLETICQKCLEREPGTRYQTAHEMSGELRRFLRKEPILARPIGRVSRAARWCRRKPMAATAACLSLLIAVASPAVAVRESWQRRAIESLESERLKLIASLQAEKQVLQAEVGRLKDIFREHGQGVDGQSMQSKFLSMASRHYGPIVEQLPADAPLEDRGSALLGLGIMRSIAGPAVDSDLLLTEAREIFRKLSDEHPTETRYKFGLAACCRQLSRRHEQRGDLEAARQSLEESLRIYQSLATERPADFVLQLGQSATLRDLAHLQAEANMHAEAFASLREANRIADQFDQLWDDEPIDALSAACLLLLDESSLIARVLESATPDTRSP